MPLHLVARNEFRSLEKVSALELPKLFVHGTEDETIPLEIGEILFAAATEPKQWYAVPGAGHSDVERWGVSEYLRILADFIQGCVG